MSQRKSRSRHVIISEHPSRAESHSPPPNSQSHDHDINQADLQQRLNSVAKSRVCDKYMLGKCPHGLRGKKEVNGEICSFSHPKKCFKYCGFGNGKKGCTIVENCEYFHPQLCKFWVSKRACYNANCTFVHLKGTFRTKQPQTIAESKTLAQLVVLVLLEGVKTPNRTKIKKICKTVPLIPGAASLV